MATRLISECDSYEPEDFEAEDSSWPHQEMHIEIFAQIESQQSYYLHREPLHHLTQPATAWSLISAMLSAARVPLPAQPSMIHKIADSVHSISNKRQNKNRKTIPMIVILKLQPQAEHDEALLEDITLSVDRDCVICLGEMKVGSEATHIPCSHVYHRSCIRTWLKNSSLCPLCRFQMSDIATATYKL